MIDSILKADSTIPVLWADVPPRDFDRAAGIMMAVENARSRLKCILDKDGFLPRLLVEEVFNEELNSRSIDFSTRTGWHNKSMTNSVGYYFLVSDSFLPRSQWEKKLGVVVRAVNKSGDKGGDVSVAGILEMRRLKLGNKEKGDGV